MAFAQIPQTIRSTHDVVDSYLARAGVTTGKPGSFWTELEERFGARTALRLGQVSEARYGGSPDPRIYSTKNARLDLSLFVTQHFLGAAHRALLRQLAALEIDPPKHIVDLGCDNGLLTCFLAYLYPGAQVLGLDVGAAGLRCGRELAGRLGLTNVTFRRADLTGALPRAFAAQTDLVLASLVYREVTEFATRGEVGGAQAEAKAEEATRCLRAVLLRLAPGARFVSLERFGSAKEAWWWQDALTAAGFVIDQDTVADLELGCGCVSSAAGSSAAPSGCCGGCAGGRGAGACSGACGEACKCAAERACGAACSGGAGPGGPSGLDWVAEFLNDPTTTADLLAEMDCLEALATCPVCHGAVHQFLVAGRQ